MRVERAEEGLLVTLATTPPLSLRLQAMPRPDLDPRWPKIAPGRPNVQDLVGLREISLNGDRPAGYWLWDNREHHYWTGYDGSFIPRHQPVDEYGFRAARDHARLWLRYRCDGVETRHGWVFQRATDGSPTVDSVTEVRNVRDEAVFCYTQLIAGYHPDSPRALFVDERQRLAEAPDYAVIALADSADGRLSAMPGGFRKPPVEWIQAGVPALLSAPLWSGGWRHALVGADAAVAAFVTWHSPTFPFRALDYVIGPPSGRLEPGRGFTARLRHAFTRERPSARLISHLAQGIG